MREPIKEMIIPANPFTKEINNFLIEIRSFAKKVTMETRIATKPALITSRIFLTAEAIPTKNFLMA